MSEPLPTILLYDDSTEGVSAMIPHVPDRVGIYCSGSGAGKGAHLESARPFVVFDVIRRYLSHRGYEVTYDCRAHDLDDTTTWVEDLVALGCPAPHTTDVPDTANQGPYDLLGGANGGTEGPERPAESGRWLPLGTRPRSGDASAADGQNRPSEVSRQAERGARAVRDLFTHHHPDVVRFFLLSSHYRRPLSYSDEALDRARARVTYVYKTVERLERFLQCSGTPGKTGVPAAKAAALSAFWPSIHTAMDHDFDTARFALVWAEHAKLANTLMPAKVRAVNDPARLKSLSTLHSDLRDAAQLVGLLAGPVHEVLPILRDLRVGQLGHDRTQIEALIWDRTEARIDREWEKADALRAQLESMGVVLMDGDNGTEWTMA